ncbi:hypothetical protein KC19_11G169800 [Ceratodon purpureus]|uniref:Uncharacterized protein n=1 Tax=Ceratodon purpureus TaxID=3225 RepID=A0A8T0GFC0_CERPU|nr:hypothetical protein KC19_11G169800 [Ceratodon purpureus]
MVRKSIKITPKQCTKINDRDKNQHNEFKQFLKKQILASATSSHPQTTPPQHKKLKKTQFTALKRTSRTTTHAPTPSTAIQLTAPSFLHRQRPSTTLKPPPPSNS